jgi:hypothetical protein
VTHRFELRRDTDVSGVSGEGVVADGVRLDSGLAVVRWHGAMPSYVLWPDYEHAVAVHGHGGLTRFVDSGHVPLRPAQALHGIVRRSLTDLRAWFDGNTA